jgi:hypothetical protein
MLSRNNPKIIPRESHGTFLGKKRICSKSHSLKGFGMGRFDKKPQTFYVQLHCKKYTECL